MRTEEDEQRVNFEQEKMQEGAGELAYVGNLPAGEYYLGDPCYVIAEDEWLNFCHLLSTFDREKMQEVSLCTNGMIAEFNGHKVFVTSTNCGDGSYRDQLGNSYPVDAGLIGLIPLALCTKRFDGLGHKFEAKSQPIKISVTTGRWIDCKEIHVNSRVIKT